jgi:hypothetical protein
LLERQEWFEKEKERLEEEAKEVRGCRRTWR